MAIEEGDYFLPNDLIHRPIDNSPPRHPDFNYELLEILADEYLKMKRRIFD